MTFLRVHIDLKMIEEQCALLVLGEEEGRREEGLVCSSSRKQRTAKVVRVWGG